MSNTASPGERLAQQTSAAQQWAERSSAAGWLAADDAASITNLSGATSADLFAPGEEASKPLVVALFGGTGVGKSSLLNRLVGEAVAKVGVIRPTSLEATMYVHKDIEFAGPVRDGFQRATHSDDARRHVVWIDMPDVDSTATHNRDLVLEFLPFVDVLVYVVSPERYRDEAPWALLRAHADRCAWVFAMNQIDRGLPEQVGVQLDDLRAALTAAGFDDPALYPTSCGGETELDEFPQLAGFIDSLAQERVREALQVEGVAARLRLLREALLDRSASWPADEHSLVLLWRSSREELRAELSGDLVERLAPVAARMASGEAAAPGELWDDWASDRVGDALTTTLLSARSAGWAKAALPSLADVVDAGLAERAEDQLRNSVRSSLARPGNAVQRALHSTCSVLIYALPLLTLGWVGWFVIRGFYGGATGAGDFVANGFALNAVLLLALSAGVPWLLGRLVKPSPRKAALAGVRQGLDELLDDVDERVAEKIDTTSAKLAALIAERDELIKGCELPGGAGDRVVERLRRS